MKTKYDYNNTTGMSIENYILWLNLWLKIRIRDEKYEDCAIIRDLIKTHSLLKY
jgi:protein-arginine kinase activator protein McsA